VLGVTHDQIGAWLLEAWGLPEELILAVRHHHDEDYWDRFSTCAQLVLIANRALARYGIGDSGQTQIPAFSLDLLGLDEQTVLAETEKLIDKSNELEDLATRLAA
jgi:HD-like signal output (HDOD) protein